MERGPRWLLALEDPDLELVFVDDRADDETGEIVDRLGAGHDRPRVVHRGERPAGCFGKIHACCRGAHEAVARRVCYHLSITTR